MRIHRHALPFVALVLGLRANAQVLLDPTLAIEVVVTGLSQPTTMAFLSEKEFLVLQKANGQVRHVLEGVLQPAPVLDVNVNTASERGLLGIATDPEFNRNHHVYLYYTEAASVDNGTVIANRVYRYTWDAGALVDPVLVLDLPVTPGPNHNGGILAFGPDDKLYAVIGELNRNGQLQNYPLGLAPDDTGVIFRVNGDGTAPADNPFYDSGNPANPMNRYYAYGLRNSFGMAFDPVTGELWETENGPSSYDEINHVLPGFNSGWEQIMGPDVRDPQGPADLWVVPGSSYSDPEFSWAATVAPTAIAFPASPKVGCGLLHDAVVADNNCGQLYRFELTPDRQALAFQSVELQDLVADNGLGRCNLEQSEILFGSSFGVVTDVKNGPDGRLYVVSLLTGTVYRIVRNPGSVPDSDADEVADECDCAPSDDSAYAFPVEIPRLRLFGPMPTSISWDAQSASAGPGTSYAVVTGSLTDLGADAGFASACVLATGLTAPAVSDVRPDPEAGEGFYYLVRAGNVCASGTFGDGSETPDPRDALDAAIPVACP